MLLDELGSMHSTGRCDAQGQDTGRSITARVLRRSSGVLESCHCWVFRLHPNPPPLAHSKHPRWDYMYPRDGMYTKFPHQTVPDNPQQWARVPQQWPASNLAVLPGGSDATHHIHHPAHPAEAIMWQKFGWWAVALLDGSTFVGNYPIWCINVAALVVAVADVIVDAFAGDVACCGRGRGGGGRGHRCRRVRGWHGAFTMWQGVQPWLLASYMRLGCSPIRVIYPAGL